MIMFYFLFVTTVVALGAPETATATTDYTLNAMSSLTLNFVDGEIEKQVDIDLVADNSLEDTEYVTASLTLTSPAPPDDKVYLDTNRMSSIIYIEDRSCKLNHVGIR